MTSRQAFRAVSPLWVFLLTTFGLSSIFYFFIIYTGQLGGGFGLFVSGLMWCPGIAAILTSIWTKKKVSSLGWRWGNWRFQLWSFLIPMLYALASYVIIWNVGWGTFYKESFVDQIAVAFGTTKVPDIVNIILYFILMGIFGLPGSFATALGEEIGWRGFLVPELYKRVGFTATAIVSGLIWAVWHYPILLFADYNSGTPAWFALSCFTLMIVSISFIFAWFRLRSGSLWTAVIMHASHNLFIQSILSPLTARTGETKYYIGEFGAVIPIVSFAVAVFIWWKVYAIKRREGNQQLSGDGRSKKVYFDTQMEQPASKL